MSGLTRYNDIKLKMAEQKPIQTYTILCDIAKKNLTNIYII